MNRKSRFRSWRRCVRIENSDQGDTLGCYRSLSRYLFTLTVVANGRSVTLSQFCYPWAFVERLRAEDTKCKKS
jgi:hypothetical protein